MGKRAVEKQDEGRRGISKAVKWFWRLCWRRRMRTKSEVTVVVGGKLGRMVVRRQHLLCVWTFHLTFFV